MISFEKIASSCDMRSITTIAKKDRKFACLGRKCLQLQTPLPFAERYLPRAKSCAHPAQPLRGLCVIANFAHSPAYAFPPERMFLLFYNHFPPLDTVLVAMGLLLWYNTSNAAPGAVYIMSEPVSRGRGTARMIADIRKDDSSCHARKPNSPRKI